MKHTLNVAYLNGVEGFRRSVNKTENGGGNVEASNWIYIVIGNSNNDNYNYTAGVFAVIFSQLSTEQGSAFSIVGIGDKHIIAPYSIVGTNLSGSYSIQGSVIQKGTTFIGEGVTFKINSIEDIYKLAKEATGCTDEEVRVSIKELDLDELFNKLWASAD